MPVVRPSPKAFPTDEHPPGDMYLMGGAGSASKAKEAACWRGNSHGCGGIEPNHCPEGIPGTASHGMGITPPRRGLGVFYSFVQRVFHSSEERLRRSNTLLIRTPAYFNPATRAEQEDRINHDEELRTNASPGRPHYRETRVFTLTGELVPSPTLSATSAYTPTLEKTNSPPSPSPLKLSGKLESYHYLTRYQTRKSRLQ